MPMMSQMFGNALSSSSGSNRITRAMEDIVADHGPHRGSKPFAATKQGIGDIYAQDLRANLRQRAVHSSDYTATPTRFPNLTSIVSS
ncbi:hypothetical protein DYB30_007195 [Aphanomyces astaci]|uniref:Uncharacterized protein n=1 Tax=Aphanomyces astaci TaxID=112090 RepID=A0A397DZ23_APHAT|nr:hypothetical protein DYB30_007195 [Aphanomyces astaci]